MSKSSPSGGLVASTEPKALGRVRDLADWATSETSDALPDVLAHFLLSLASDRTRRSYRNDIRDYLEFCMHLGIPAEKITHVTEESVLLWRDELMRRHVHGARVVRSTVARKLSALSSLLEFALRRQLIKANPASLVRRPKVGRESRTNAFTADEVGRFLEQLENEVTSKADGTARDYRSARLRQVVLFTLLSVGMRVDELLELRIGDFERTDTFARLHMTAKGGEGHAPIIHPRTAGMLTEYISEFRAQALPSDYLFVRAQNVRRPGKLSQVAVYNMVNEVARRAGIDKRLSPHSCRATLATLLHNSGVPIGQIQDLLNHKQITTTAIYIKKAQELSESAATKIGPLI